MALGNTFMPRLGGRDASIFAELLRDLWPSMAVALTFAGRVSDLTLNGEVVSKDGKSCQSLTSAL